MRNRPFSRWPICWKQLVTAMTHYKFSSRYRTVSRISAAKSWSMRCANYASISNAKKNLRCALNCWHCSVTLQWTPRSMRSFWWMKLCCCWRRKHRRKSFRRVCTVCTKLANIKNCRHRFWFESYYLQSNNWQIPATMFNGTRYYCSVPICNCATPKRNH